MIYFLILKNYSTVKKLEEFVMGSFLSKKKWVKIKNLLLKGKEFSHLNTCGEIILRKDVDLDVLCFGINFDGYFPARIHLWLQDHATAPPTPAVSDVSSADSGYDCQ